MNKVSTPDEIFEYLKSIDASVEITEYTDLVESNLLTSLNMMGLVALIEKTKGVQLDIQDIDISKMRTIAMIRQNYLAL